MIGIGRALAIQAAWIAFAMAAATASFAQGIDRKISYQGQIQGVSGSVTVQFRIYDGAGTAVWGPELHMVTPDAQGRFVAVVGTTGLDVDSDGTPDLDQLDPNDELELEITIQESGQSPVVLSPRQRIFAAFHASSANSVIDSSVSHPKLVVGVQQALVPTGAVLPFAGPSSAVPPGWLLCDGAERQQADYPGLFGVIGSAHGGSVTTFFVPDYRGRHLRGVDAGTSRDPRATARDAMAAGGNVGDLVGSVQGDQLQNHIHSASSPVHDHGNTSIDTHSHRVIRRLSDGTIYDMAWGNGDDSPTNHLLDAADAGQVGNLETRDDSHYHDTNALAVGVSVGGASGANVGTETRVDNAFVNFIIRCGPGDAC